MRRAGDNPSLRSHHERFDLGGRNMSRKRLQFRLWATRVGLNPCPLDGPKVKRLEQLPRCAEQRKRRRVLENPCQRGRRL